MRRFWMIGLGIVALIVSMVAVSSFKRPVVGLDSAEAANAMHQTAGSLPKVITVVGQGKVTVKPDMAETSIGVRATGATVAEATGKANTDMDSVLKALKAAGIEDKDIQTSGFNLNPSQDRNGQPNGYEVMNMLRVRIRDLSKVGAVMDAAISAGANQIYGVSFTLANPDTAQSQARVAAVKDAQARANELAQAAGVGLGELVQVSNVVTGGPVMPYMSGKGAAMEMSIGQMQPGELEVTMQVQVIYQIK